MKWIRFRAAFLLVPAALAGWSALRAQKPFREYPGLEYENFPLPPGWDAKTEWTRARLKCPGINQGYRGDNNWTIDYPRSDRHLLQGVRRLTRIDARSVEQITELDGTDDVYNWPMLYAVEVGHWYLPDKQAAQLRDFLLRGGFLMPMVHDFFMAQRIIAASMNGKDFCSTASRGFSPIARSWTSPTAMRSSIPFTTWTTAFRFREPSICAPD